MDSTGVSHILEHTALCGSQRYPVRDPFFKMLNRSLSSFMNAFTGNGVFVLKRKTMLLLISPLTNILRTRQICYSLHYLQL